MSNPFFWLGISILLVAISLMALLTVAILVLQELARAARSAEKLLDNLNRELPATLQDLRMTGKEISVLTDEVSGSMQSARSVVQQVDQSLVEVKAQAQKAQITTRSLFAGATAAFRVLTQQQPRRRRSRPPTRRPPISEPVAPPVNSHNQPTATATSQKPLEMPESNPILSTPILSETDISKPPTQPNSTSKPAIHPAPQRTSGSTSMPKAEPEVKPKQSLTE